MTILVDGDSCPRPLLPVIERACQRLRVPAVFVANRDLPLPRSAWLSLRLCPPSESAADEALVRMVQRHDLALTRDTELARRLLERGATVISPHGHQFTVDNVASKTSEARALAELRALGIAEASPPARNYGPRQVQRFAAVFDRCLAQLHNVGRTQASPENQHNR